MVEAMCIPAEVLKLRLNSRRLPEQLDHARSNELGSESPRSLFHGEFDDMSDGTGHQILVPRSLQRRGHSRPHTLYGFA
jgi:hypothetical protein